MAGRGERRWRAWGGLDPVPLWGTWHLARWLSEEGFRGDTGERNILKREGAGIAFPHCSEKHIFIFAVFVKAASLDISHPCPRPQMGREMRQRFLTLPWPPLAPRVQVMPRAPPVPPPSPTLWSGFAASPNVMFRPHWNTRLDHCLSWLLTLPRVCGT